MDTIRSIPGGRGGIIRLDKRHWTYDDLREMPESMDRLEIVNGDLYMSPSGHVWRHQNAVGNLFFELRRWIDRHALGKVFVSPADVVLAPDRVVQPDIFFVSHDRLGIVGAYVSGAPDLVVEVLSPSSIVFDRKTKFALYEETGVREYWLVDPDGRRVEVYVLREGRYEQLGQFGAGEEACSDVLKGFTVSVDRIFA